MKWFVTFSAGFITEPKQRSTGNGRLQPTDATDAILFDRLTCLRGDQSYLKRRCRY